MFALGVIVGCAAVVLLAAVSALIDGWRHRRNFRRALALPPATRPQLDRAARANRPDLRIVRERDDRSMN